MKKNKVIRNPFFNFVKMIMRIFVRKPKVLNLNTEDLDVNAIYLTNHVGSKGPVKHELYFPHNFKFWGTYEMTVGFKERWSYLANIYFHQKKHINIHLSRVIATLALPFLSIFYAGMKLIPTYRDARLFKTIKFSIDYLKQGNSIIIFPENSDNGYFDELTEYRAGFVLLVKQYYKKTGHNIKIYNMYLRRQDNTLIIDKPINIEHILSLNMSDKEIANMFKERANELSHITVNNKEKKC